MFSAISNCTVSTRIYNKCGTFDFEIVNYSFVNGDVPCSISYGFHIFQLILFARASSQVANFNTHNQPLTMKFLNRAVSIISFAFLQFLLLIL